MEGRRDAVRNAIELPEQRSSRRSDQPPQGTEASNVRSRRPGTDEGENDAAESQKLRKDPVKCETTARSSPALSLPHLAPGRTLGRFFSRRARVT